MASSDGHESIQGSEDTATLQNAEIRTEVRGRGALALHLVVRKNRVAQVGLDALHEIFRDVLAVKVHEALEEGVDLCGTDTVVSVHSRDA